MKILKHFIIIILSCIFLIASLPILSKNIFESGLLSDDYRFGDLYRLSNLAQFKELKSVCHKVKIESNPSNHLYVLGDSFLEKERIQKEDFPVSKYQYSHLDNIVEINVDTSKNNILLIETVERHLREHFKVKADNFKTTSVFNKSKPTEFIEVFNAEKFQAIFFSNTIIEKIKEFKAKINLELFERTDPKVSLSNDKNHILLKLDTDASKINSNFNEISQTEIETIILNLNETHKYYKNLGFDEIYLSIIPNKTTVCCQNDGNYNRIIEKIQNDKNLKLKAINVLKEFENKNYYEKGDTHWNCEGQEVYLKLVNRAMFK